MSDPRLGSGSTRRFGRYELQGAIGRGGNGAVYRGRAPDGREVAVKLLHRVEAGSLARFDRERRLLETLGETEGFVPLLDFGAQPQPHIVMPFLGGGTLRDRLARGPLSIEETLRLGRSLGAALGRAAALGIVHRDMKPENVLFDHAERPLVADLGLGKHFLGDTPGAAASSVSLSQDGSILGTAGYMAPEQMRDAKGAGPAADVFALGAILYECLAGAPVFAGESVHEVLGKVDAGVRRPLLALRPEVPKWLDRAIAKALAQKPEERFPTGAELAGALFAPGEKAPRAAGLGLAIFLAVGGIFFFGTGVGIWLGRSERPAAPALPAAPPPTAEPAHAPPPPPPPPPPPKPAVDPIAAALEKNPDDTDALTARALAAKAKGDLAAAHADLSRVVTLRHGDPAPLRSRAAVRELEGDIDGALADYKTAAAIAPDAGTFTNIGLLREKKGQIDLATANYAMAIRTDAQYAPAWLRRGLLHKKTGDAKTAREELGQAAALDAGPVGDEARAALAELGR